MSFYFSIFCVLAYFSFIEIFGLKERQRTVMFLLFSFCMFVLSFIRWEIGTDWGTYFNFFNQSDSWFIESEYEWGFARINEFAKIIFDNYSVLLFVLGSVLFSFQTAAIYRLSPYPITSLLFVWSVSFGNAMFIRQTIATAILFFSIIYIKDSKFWKFLFCIGLATCFHRTSLIFLPAWYIYRLNINMTWWCLGICVSVLLTVMIKNIFEIMMGVMGPVVQYKLDVYLSDSEATFGTEVSLSYIIIKGVMNKLIAFGAILLLFNKMKTMYSCYRGLVNLYWFGIIIYFSTIGVSVALVRLSFAYDIVQIVVIPMLFTQIANKQWKMLFYGVFLLYMGLRLYIALTSNYYDLYVPFKTVFS